VHHIVLVEVVHGFKYLSNCLGGVFLRELALFANAIEQFSSGGEFGDDVVFVLSAG
jgi:hypothetical protein